MTLRTFLVEDSEIIRANLEETLIELADARVIGHTDGEAKACAWFEQNVDHWDLAVVDLFLKQGSGLALLTAQRHRPKHQKMVVLSNYATRDIRDRCAALGADAVFDKSTELDDLIEWCRSMHL